MSGPGEDVLTVERLNERVAAAVDAADLGDVRVVGEVTDPNETGSAVYFTLTDGDAELDCVLWQSRYRSIEADVETGTEVVVRGGLDYWVEGGRLSLKPWSVTPVGEGDRARRIARLRSELEARGWFAAERKTEPPAYPDRVGVVTSRDGDARHDVATSVHERNPTVDVVLRHATVQGPDAPTEIAAAVASLDRRPDVDVVVVGRGGGSETDLDAFDTETVAEAIVAAETPVVAAVGHTEDDTVAGDVADVDAITPTEAGSVVAPLDATRERLDEIDDRLSVAYDRRASAAVDALAGRVDDAYRAAAGRELSRLARDLRAAYARRVSVALADLDATVAVDYGRLVDDRLDRLERRLAAGYETAAPERLDALDRRLETAYRRRVDRRLTELSADVDVAVAGYERSRDAERRLRTQRRRYRVAIAGLTALLLLLLAWVTTT